MISFDYLLALYEHISDVIRLELQTANFFNILYIGIIEFAVFYFFSKFAKNIYLKTFIFLFGLKMLFDMVHYNKILTEPIIFGLLGLIAPHFNIFSLWIRYIQKLFIAIKTMIMSFLDYILSPLFWLKDRVEILSSLFRKKENSQQKNYKQEKTYQDYFYENKNENSEYEKQKSEYYKNKQKQNSNQNNSSHNKKQSEQKKQKKEQQQQKSYQQNHKQKTNQKSQYEQKKKTNSSSSNQKTYSRWDSPNPYEVLGVRENANQREIKKAFRNLAKIYHPDLTQTNKEQHKIIFQKINNAYKKLKS